MDSIDIIRLVRQMFRVSMIFIIKYCVRHFEDCATWPPHRYKIAAETHAYKFYTIRECLSNKRSPSYCHFNPCDSILRINVSTIISQYKQLMRSRTHNRWHETFIKKGIIFLSSSSILCVLAIRCHWHRIEFHLSE